MIGMLWVTLLSGSRTLCRTSIATGSAPSHNRMFPPAGGSVSILPRAELAFSECISYPFLFNLFVFALCCCFIFIVGFHRGSGRIEYKNVE